MKCFMTAKWVSSLGSWIIYNKPLPVLYGACFQDLHIINWFQEPRYKGTYHVQIFTGKITY